MSYSWLSKTFPRPSETMQGPVTPTNHFYSTFPSCYPSSRFLPSGAALSLHRYTCVRSRGPLFRSVQFSSVAQSCPTLCDPMDCSTLGLPVHHQLPEFTQTHVHWVSDAIQPSHPLSGHCTKVIFNQLKVFQTWVLSCCACCLTILIDLLSLSLFISKANHSISQLSKSMPQPVMLKKLKLNSFMKTYKTF